ncbi:MAG: ROK family protein [Bacteroidetes bacterium]|nr:MAG: ROK family protein [Bacteroidota bacterium]
MANQIVLGVDIGGSGIKGGLIDVKRGEMISERHRIPTPRPATPKAVAQTFKELVAHFDWQGPVGVGFPAIVHHGVAHSAANIDPAWIGQSIEAILSKASACDVHVLNDADAAGIAAMQYGVGKGEKGVVLMLTIGTGIGSALFIDGKLVPNTEFGHLYLKGDSKVAEKFVSNKAREIAQLEWEDWGVRLDTYLHHIDRLLTPDLVIIGGGGSKRFDKFKDKLTVDFRVVPAGLLNKAGAIGAAWYAWEVSKKKKS